MLIPIKWELLTIVTIFVSLKEGVVKLCEKSESDIKKWKIKG